MSVSDECYTKNLSCAPNWISTFLFHDSKSLTNWDVCLFVCFLFYFFCWVHVAHYLSFLCCYFFVYVLCIVCPMFLKHFFFVIFHFYRQCKRYNTFTQDITHLVLTLYWITTDIKLFHLKLSWSELQTILYLMELFPLSFRKYEYTFFIYCYLI